MIRLLLCDLDGTLVETWRTTPLPDVRERLRLLQDQGVPVVVVTNQGGVGYRYVYEQRGEWATAAQYPTFEDVQARLVAIAECLPFCRSYISLYHGRPDWPRPDAYHRIEFHTPVPAFWSWRPDWHKPQPGMLLQALEDLAVAPSEALMVGDRNEDREAARAAGVPFRWATADWMLW
jgi:D-glycero-D-manno-heptose 1,7-bisphosphate phosphatase